MKPHHISILAAMQDHQKRWFTIKEVAETTGMTTMRVKNALIDLHYSDYIVVPPRQRYDVDHVKEWRLSARGKRLVEAMRRHFKGE